MIVGDSCYHRRHGKGHCKGLHIPSGALVDFMLQKDMKIVELGSKTIQGIFLGYRVQSGGLWNSDYIVADYQPFKRKCDVLESKVDIHRINEALKSLSGVFTFLVAELLRKGDFEIMTSAPMMQFLTYTTKTATAMTARNAKKLPTPTQNTTTSYLRTQTFSWGPTNEG